MARGTVDEYNRALDASGRRVGEEDSTRRHFLKVAGAGMAGAVLIGGAGMRRSAGDERRPDHHRQPEEGPVGAYGNSWIKTPSLDAFARESLRFTRAYPESLPTICARRAIHTGFRTFRIKTGPRSSGTRRPTGGSIPAEQATLAETSEARGYQTMLVTDTYHQFRPLMDFNRGFDTYHWIRGRRRTTTGPSSPPQTRRFGNATSCTGGPQGTPVPGEHQGQRDRGGLVRPRVFLRATVPGGGQQAGAVLPGRTTTTRTSPWDPPEKYTSYYPEGYDGPEPFTTIYGRDDYLDRAATPEDARPLRGRGHHGRPLARPLPDRMDELDLFENTLILLSDHGHALGEHGYTGKPHYALWPELTDIVFMIRHPEGKGAGETSDHYASTTTWPQPSWASSA